MSQGERHQHETLRQCFIRMGMKRWEKPIQSLLRKSHRGTSPLTGIQVGNSLGLEEGVSRSSGGATKCLLETWENKNPHKPLGGSLGLLAINHETMTSALSILPL